MKKEVVTDIGAASRSRLRLAATDDPGPPRLFLFRCCNSFRGSAAGGNSGLLAGCDGCPEPRQSQPTGRTTR